MSEDVAAGGGGTPNFSDFLERDSTQLAGVDASDAGAFSEFVKANRLPVGEYGDPSASFNGSGGGFLGVASGTVTSSKRGEETVDGIKDAGRGLFREDRLMGHYRSACKSTAKAAQQRCAVR
ncbi:MAG: hypothetical protein AAFQ64_15875 [Pseudomonadota bacterium]